MTKREVAIGMATYTDVDGARRIGLAGEQVDVHADDVARFDAVNGTAPPRKTAAPQKRAAPRRK
jgi:hypothetical protein